MAFKCPSCREETISLKQKYLLGWWMTTSCSQCGARVAAFPWTLMLLFFFYTWNVVWWSGMAYYDGSYHYLIYMAICWVFIDLANIYLMHLASLRKKQPKS